MEKFGNYKDTPWLTAQFNQDLWNPSNTSLIHCKRLNPNNKFCYFLLGNLEFKNFAYSFGKSSKLYTNMVQPIVLNIFKIDQQINIALTHKPLIFVSFKIAH
jgi:hypothetical protein